MTGVWQDKEIPVLLKVFANENFKGIENYKNLSEVLLIKPPGKTMGKGPSSHEIYISSLTPMTLSVNS